MQGKMGSHFIEGTKHSPQSSQLLVSSGIPSLDTLVGGGLPVGTVALIEEDMYGSYSKVMLKYFLAEGIVSKHSIFLASQDVNPDNIVKELPSVIASEPNSVSNTSDSTGDKMKIAFRYERLPTHDTEPKVQPLGHFFDLTKTMPVDDLENSDIQYWNGKIIENGASTFLNPAYNALLKSIKTKIKDGQFFLKDNPQRRTVLRIGIHSLGSPLWLPHRKSMHSIESTRDLDMFLFCLRALVRSANAVALVTIPSRLYHEHTLDRCIHSSDIAMRLQSFAGTELETNKALSDYHGFFHLTKLAAINTLLSKHPGSVDYVFKLRRKKFVIEMLHLPPDMGDEGTEKKAKATQGCFSSNSQLDF